MNTYDSAAARNRGAPPVSFRARGCVLMEESREAEELAARKEAADIKDRLEREQIRRAAEEAAEKRLQAQLEAMRQAQQKLWTQFHAEMGKTLRELEADIKHQLIGMTIRTAEILLCHKLPDAEMLRNIMQEVLSPISDLQGVRVRVAKGTLHLLTGDADIPLQHPGIECVEDPELKTGDVVVESRNGIFDGRLRLRLEQLAEALSQPPVEHSADK